MLVFRPVQFPVARRGVQRGDVLRIAGGHAGQQIFDDGAGERGIIHRSDSARAGDASPLPPTSCESSGQDFLLGMTTTTMRVRMLKNSPSSPHPNGLRPLAAAMAAQMNAAMMLPMATKIL